MEKIKIDDLGQIEDNIRDQIEYNKLNSLYRLKKTTEDGIKALLENLDMELNSIGKCKYQISTYRGEKGYNVGNIDVKLEVIID